MVDINTDAIRISQPYRPLDVGQILAARDSRQASAAAGADREYAHQRQVQQDELADSERTTLAGIGNAYNSGGTVEAGRMAAGAGRFDIVDQLRKMDDAARERLAKISEGTTPVLSQLRQYPTAVRSQVAEQAKALLREKGLDEEHIAKLDLSDQGLDLAIANGTKISEFNQKVQNDRTYAAGRGDHTDMLANQQQTREDVRRGQEITLRGQNMTDARARDAVDALGKAPSGYRWTGDGSLQAIKGGPGDTTAGGGKPLTETQAKATGYYGRATMANRTLNEFESKGTPPPGAGAKLADEVPLGLASGLIGDANQQQLAARRAFVAAVLRQESGAAISNSEFKSYDKLYFPQQGDTKETRAYKRQLRDQAAKSLAIAAGPGAGQMEMAIPASGGGVPADIAAILAKHK